MFPHQFPSQEIDSLRGRDTTPILVGDTPVTAGFHDYMMKAASTNPPATQTSFFTTPPRDIGSRPADKSKHHKAKDKKDNERAASTPKPAATGKP